MASFDLAKLFSAADVHEKEFRYLPLLCDNAMVNGKIEMKRLEPGAKYEVMFVILMLNPSGFDPKATFSLALPSGVTREKKVSLKAIKPKEWVKVSIGSFVATEEDGDVMFSLKNHEKLNWKRGMIIEGVLIQPCA